jgi:hypothetical protein
MSTRHSVNKSRQLLLGRVAAGISGLAGRFNCYQVFLTGPLFLQNHAKFVMLFLNK